MFRSNGNTKLLQEQRRVNEIRELARKFARELKEALAPKDIENIIGKYMGKVSDPSARSDFLMQTAQFLGRTSSVSPEDLDMALRQHYAKNYDPAKIARGQTPSQRASVQAKKNPPPIPQKAPPPQAKQPPQQPEKEPDMPSLKSLASQETDPVWKKHNLPTPDELEKSRAGQSSDKQNAGEEDDIPMADPSDVKSVGGKKSSAKKEKEVDMDAFGSKQPGEKPAKSSPSSSQRKKKTAATAVGKDVPMPSFGSVLRGQMKSQNDRTGGQKWKVGQTVNVGNSKGYKVVGKNGSFWNLEKNGNRYVFRPFKGLTKVS